VTRLAYLLKAIGCAAGNGKHGSRFTAIRIDSKDGGNGISQRDVEAVALCVASIARPPIEIVFGQFGKAFVELNGYGECSLPKREMRYPGMSTVNAS
jgi:hypothetical protein